MTAIQGRGDIAYLSNFTIFPTLQCNVMQNYIIVRFCASRVQVGSSSLTLESEVTSTTKAFLRKLEAFTSLARECLMRRYRRSVPNARQNEI